MVLMVSKNGIIADYAVMVGLPSEKQHVNGSDEK
jgi:hypothetical protein